MDIPPAPPRPPKPPKPRNLRRYLVGLGIGLVPVLVYWLSGVFICPYGYYSGVCPGPHDANLSNFLYGAGIVLYLVSVVAALALLFNRAYRFVGYGMLTMVFVDPIIGVAGCLAINGLVHQA
jgi:hypothetical protein